MKTIIVLPTVRPQLLPKFFQEWVQVKGMESAHWIIVEDSPKKTALILPKTLHHTHVSWEELEKEPDNWIISRRTSAIRSFGFLLAHRMKPDLVITLDDDCLPEDAEFLHKHILQLSRRVMLSWTTSWDNLLPIWPRGVPYEIRQEKEVKLNHGVWSEVPDLDGITQKANPSLSTIPMKRWKVIPKGTYFPMCGMNLAFKPEVLPLMYFGLQGPAYPFDRFDDIWCGVIAKKICDHLGWAITSGLPSVRHTRRSNVDVNIKKEEPGIVFNEVFWTLIDQIDLKGCKTTKECMVKIARDLPNLNEDPYMLKLKEAMEIWANKF